MTFAVEEKGEKMGTNYYAVRNRPTTREPIHIGKSSMGWMFLFHQHNDTWDDPPVIWNTFGQVKEWLKKYTVDSNEFVIMTEYDETVTFEDFFEMVDAKQKDDQCRGNPDNFVYCKNVDGYRFDDRDFC